MSSIHSAATQRRWQRLLVISAVLTTVATLFFASTIFAGHAQAFSRLFTPAPANTAVLTQKYNTARTGWNPNETILNTTNVNTTNFGRLISYPVDGQIYAQPLFVPNVTTSAGTFNLVIVATEHDSVYAFDADRSVTTPIWHISFLGANITSVPTSVAYPGGFKDITPEVGITGTPAIDSSTNSLYVDAMTIENGTVVHRLHMLDITTGLDKVPSVIVGPTANGKGDGNVNQVIHFNAVTENERMNLLLLNGKVYIGYAGFADQYPYHGWIVGFDAQTLQQTDVFNDTTNGGGGGLWDDGNGFVVDPSDSSIYVQSGNGTFDYNVGGATNTDLGMSLIHLSTTGGLKVLDYFTPFNAQCLNTLDRDLGSGGAILLPTQGGAHPNEILGGGKEGRIYLLDRTNLGQYAVVANACTNQNVLTYDNVVQEMNLGAAEGNSAIYSTPAFWQGPNGAYIYEAGNGDFIKAFSLTNGLLSTAPTSQSPETFTFPGENLTVSSNGSTAGTGIVWAISPNASCPVLDHCNPAGAGVLRAYDATNLGTELYSSSQNTARDGLASFIKFTVPIVANGQVFVGTGSSLDIFGLNPPNPTPTPTPTPGSSPTPTPTTGPPPPNTYNNIGITDDSATTAGNFDGLNSYSAEALAAAHVVPGAAIPVNNAAFIWPNVAAGTPDNWQANGQSISVTPVAGAQTLCFLGAAAAGNSSGTGVIHYADGTTQAFTLAFTDWANATPIPSNVTVLTTAYRNTQTGKDSRNFYVFYTDVALLAGKTITTVTLPTTASPGSLHVFAIATTASAAVSGGTNTSQAKYNNVGVTDDSAASKGNYDGVNSYSAQALAALGITPGSAFTFNGVTFLWPTPAAGVVDNWKANGQVILVTPVAGATTLAFLGSATSGPSSAVITLNYTDGTSQTYTITYNDWTLGGGSQKLVSGEQIALTTPVRNNPKGQQAVKTYIFYTDVPLTVGKTLKSVTLPTTVSQGTFHVFTVGTKSATSAMTPYNNVGITDDAATTSGNFDGLNSYSLEALAAVGVTPGSVVTVDGISYVWPNVAGGLPNDYQANGQAIPYTSVAGATTLGLLGASTLGPVSGTATITYTDGTTQTFTLAFSDWTLNGGSSTPIANNLTAITTAYRNLQGGKDTTRTYVFAFEVTLQAGKTVASVTLPAVPAQGTIHVFAIGSKVATAAATHHAAPKNEHAKTIIKEALRRKNH